MKKVIGIVITIISFGMNSYGVLLLAASEFVKNKPYNDSDKLVLQAILFLIMSAVFFIVGIFLIATKSKKYRKMEMELSNLKYAQGK